jgi:serine/threonine protein kinase
VTFPERSLIDERAAALIRRMLDKNRHTRIKMHEIMQDSWLFPGRVQNLSPDNFDEISVT